MKNRQEGWMSTYLKVKSGEKTEEKDQLGKESENKTTAKTTEGPCIAKDESESEKSRNESKEKCKYSSWNWDENQTLALTR